MKKDPIDKLFEEKLKNYGEVPDEKVWKSIEDSLNKKKKSRTIIPLWWKLGGAAAILMLMVYLFAPEMNTPMVENPVTGTQNAQPPAQDNNPVTDSRGLTPSKEPNAVTATENEAEEKEEITLLPASEQQAAKQGEFPNNSIIREEDSATQSTDVKEAIQVATGNQDPTRIGNTINKIDDKGQQKGQQLAENGVPGKDMDVQRTEVAGNADRTRQAETSGSNSKPDEDGELEVTSGKKSIFDELKESEKEEVANSEDSKWSVGARVAPVYFNSFGEGSPIHSNFVANPKSGNINFSYGLSLSYAITPRLSIRSGVNKVDYGYDTNDISFSPTLAASPDEKINTINYSLTSRNLVVRNSSQAKVAQQALSSDVSADFPSRNGRMVQQFGYVEIPLELNLELVNSKLGFHVIGGLSSLFLVDNSVNLVSDGKNMEMGEANNLNSMNFSTNLGFGLDYNITPRMKLNLEPVFKYQLNTFSETAGNFNPYSIGVYSGLNFRF